MKKSISLLCFSLCLCLFVNAQQKEKAPPKVNIQKFKAAQPKQSTVSKKKQPPKVTVKKFPPPVLTNNKSKKTNKKEIPKVNISKFKPPVVKEPVKN